MSVIVLDGHSRAAVEAVQSLGQLGVQVDVSCEEEDGLAFQSGYVSSRYRQPPYSSSAPSFLEWLRSIHAQRNYELIIPSTEASLLVLRGLPPADALRTRAVLPSNEALDVALDKQSTWSLAIRLRIRVPESRLITSETDLSPVGQFPVVLKPSRSKIVREDRLLTLAPVLVLDEDHRRSWLSRWLPMTSVLQQNFIPGRGVGVEFLYAEGKEVWHFAHERIHELPLTGGASTYRRSIVPDPQLLSDSRKLLDALQWHGVAMVEFRVDSAGTPWLMEINPRLWGSVALPIDAGVNFPLGLLRLARGAEPLPQPNYKSFYYSRDLRRDLEWIKVNWKADRGNKTILTQPRGRALLQFLRPLLGKESWDHFDVSDLGVTRTILRDCMRDLLRGIQKAIRNARRERNIIRHHRSVVRSLSRLRAPRKRILFLCSGNICRSPLAAELAKQEMSGLAICSAGLHAKQADRCPPNILRLAAATGIDLSGHRPIQVTRDMLDDTDLVLFMDPENYQDLADQFPAALDRATALGLFAARPSVRIADPFLASGELTRRVTEQIHASLKGLAQSMQVPRTD